MNTDFIEQGTGYAQRITPSVVALARLIGKTPKQLADALTDDDKNGDFKAELAGELIKVYQAKAKADKADKKAQASGGNGN